MVLLNITSAFSQATLLRTLLLRFNALFEAVDSPHRCEHNQQLRLTNDSHGTPAFCPEGPMLYRHGDDGNQSKFHKRPSNRTEKVEGQPSKRLRIATASQLTENSFSSLRSRFLPLPTDGRLQFLSWLFEEALAPCTSGPESAANIPPKTCGIEDRDVRLARCRSQPHDAAKTSDKSDGRQEDEHLVKLKRDQGLPSSDVMRLFSE